MLLLEPSLTGSFDHSSAAGLAFDLDAFEVLGSNGTVSAGAFSEILTDSFFSSDSEVAFEATVVEDFVIDLSPLPVLRIPFSYSAKVPVYNQAISFAIELLNESSITSSNGTKPAVQIFHNQGTFFLTSLIDFQSPGLRRVGLLYPRRAPVFRNRSASTSFTSFGFFTLRDIRASSQKRFTLYQVYPTSLR
jgi:hypothetical protein